MKGVKGAVTPIIQRATLGSVKQSQCDQSDVDSRRERDEDTVPRPASKVSRTHRGGDTGKVSKAMEEEEEGGRGGGGGGGGKGGVLLEPETVLAELDESPQVSTISVIFHKATNGTTDYYSGDG